VTLVQPSAQVRAHGLDPARLDPASRALLKDELFGRHLETRVIDSQPQDQLTRELQEFVECVHSGNSARVSGASGRDAVVLAERILHSLCNHTWMGVTAGPTGPANTPSPAGSLFRPQANQEVA